jgi:hypothetical protein
MGAEMGKLTCSLLTVMRFINDTGATPCQFPLWSTASVRPLAVHTRFQLSENIALLFISPLFAFIILWGNWLIGGPVVMRMSVYPSPYNFGRVFGFSPNFV